VFWVVLSVLCLGAAAMVVAVLARRLWRAVRTLLTELTGLADDLDRELLRMQDSN